MYRTSKEQLERNETGQDVAKRKNETSRAVNQNTLYLSALHDDVVHNQTATEQKKRQTSTHLNLLSFHWNHPTPELEKRLCAADYCEFRVVRTEKRQTLVESTSFEKETPQTLQEKPL